MEKTDFDAIYEGIGSVFRGLREDLNRTRAHVALQAGLSPSTVANVESYGGGTVEAVIRLSRALGVRPSEVFAAAEGKCLIAPDDDEAEDWKVAMQAAFEALAVERDIHLRQGAILADTLGRLNCVLDRIEEE